MLHGDVRARARSTFPHLLGVVAAKIQRLHLQKKSPSDAFQQLSNLGLEYGDMVMSKFNPPQPYHPFGNWWQKYSQRL